MAGGIDSGAALDWDGAAPNVAGSTAPLFQKGDHSDLIRALDTIGCADLDRGEWCRLMAGWKAAGLPYEAIDSWNQRDAARYDERANRRTWDSFKRAEGAGAGTVARIIREHGGTVPTYGGGKPATGREGTAEAVAEGAAGQLAQFARAVFRAGDLINVVTASAERGDGKRSPAGKGADVPLSELLGAMEAEPSAAHLLEGLGLPYDPEAGAWVRVNPVDGRGVSDSDVTRHDNVLIECDEGTREEQRAGIEAMREAGAPVVAVVDSGNKSLHAVVRVGAGDSADLWRERAAGLLAVARSCGLKPDRACMNPARLMRLPGALRGGRAQALEAVYSDVPAWDGGRVLEAVSKPATGAGAPRWPEPMAYGEMLDRVPDPEPPIIRAADGGGIIGRGDKMLIAAKSKAGKTWFAMQMAEAFACGAPWLGMEFARGPVLYVNTELHASRCKDRLRAVARANGFSGEGLARYLITWNLRGLCGPLPDMEGRIIEAAGASAKSAGTPLLAVILDPLYKMEAGSENDAKDVADLVNCMERIAERTGAALIYTHHFAKGAAGAKESMDRASGSGVFARDPDAILTITPLALDEDQDAALAKDYPRGMAARAEFTVRNYPTPRPFSVVCAPPRHVLDPRFSACGLLGENPGAEANERSRKRAAKRNAAAGEALRAAVEGLEAAGEPATPEAVYEAVDWDGLARRTGEAAPGFPRFRNDWLAPSRKPDIGWFCKERGRDSTGGIVRPVGWKPEEDGADEKQPATG